MLRLALRRAGGLRALGGASAALQSANLPHILSVAGSGPQTRARTLTTQRNLAHYVLMRAKAVQVATRFFLAYRDLTELDNTSSSLSRLFARSATLTERLRMYLVCLIPPDEPVDLRDFLTGAKQAAHAVYFQVYSDNNANRTVGSTDYPPPLDVMASDECVAKWASKLEKQREALGVPASTKFELEKLEVHDVRLAEVEYSYTRAAVGQVADTMSMFQMNESLLMTVRYAVTEHLLTVPEQDEEPTRHTLKTTFDWSFSSDVSRAHLVDWYITATTPFKLELATGKQDAKKPQPPEES